MVRRPLADPPQSQEELRHSSMPLGAGKAEEAAAAGANRLPVERQLAALFGESLFKNKWDDSRLNEEHVSAKRVGNGRRATWLRRGAALLICATLALGVTWVIRRGLSRQLTEQRAQWSHELSLLLQDGDLERASRVLSLLRGNADVLAPGDPHFDRMLRVEAALYRYHDADPARLRRIQNSLALSSLGPSGPQSSSSQVSTASLPGSPPVSPERMLAGLIVVSRRERAERLASLEALLGSMPQDSECHYLLATALEQRGDVEAARAAWNRSRELGPAWLAHRFEQAAFEHRHGSDEALAKVVQHMKRVAPSAPWTDLAAAFSAHPPAPKGGTPERVLPVIAAAPPLPSTAPAASADGFGDSVSRVRDHRALLLESADAFRRGELALARRLLASAISIVHGERSFVLDAFDWLIEERAPALARELTAFDEWPASLPIAKTMLAKLTEPAAPSVADKSAQPTVLDGRSKPGLKRVESDAPPNAGKAKKRSPTRKPPRGKGHS